jgi:hypothetical protein
LENAAARCRLTRAARTAPIHSHTTRAHKPDPTPQPAAIQEKRMPTRPWPIATFAALILIAFLAPSVLAQANTAQENKPQDIKPQNTRERWYILELAGSPAGHMSSITTTTGEGDARTITTDASLVLSIARAGAKINVTQESRFIETAAGKPISMRSRQVMGGEIIQEYVFKEDSVELTTRQPAGEPKVSTLKLPEGPWLPPAAAEAYARQRVAAGATELTVRTMDPTLGPTIITAERKIGAKTTIEIAGRAIAVTEHTVTMSNMPGMKTTEMVDEAGDMVQSRTQLGGIPIVMTASTRAEALQERAGEMPELMTTTFITPDKPIKQPRDTVRASYLLRVKEGQPVDLATTSAQRVQNVDATTVRVIVDTIALEPAPKQDVENAAFLGSSAMIEPKDAKIISLAQQAVEQAGVKGRPKAEIAEALRRFAFTYIKKKNLGVGFASATEVARSREGDCTEHGVFLASLLRARGIPSRVVSGLIYADSFAGSRNIFGYHMWAQALLDIDGEKRWVDLDATLPAAHPTDATHIAVVTSELADGELGVSMMPVAQMMGRVDIIIESIEHAGDTKPEPK